MLLNKQLVPFLTLGIHPAAGEACRRYRSFPASSHVLALEIMIGRERVKFLTRGLENISGRLSELVGPKAESPAIRPKSVSPVHV